MAKMQNKSKTSDISLIDPMLVQPYTIQRVVRETFDTFSLELEPQPQASSGRVNKTAR